MKPELSRNEVAALLAYDPDTGLFTWNVTRSGCGGMKAGDVAGTVNVKGYRRVSINYRYYAAHRLAFLLMTGAWPTQQVDHLNGQRDDNRWSNLREASNALNKQNMRKARQDNKTGLLGVRPFRGRFRATIMLNGQSKHLGVFDSPDVAHAVYLAHKRILHPGSTL